MNLSDYPEPHGDLSNAPARAPHRGGKVRYPWTTLQPGEWFLFPLSFKFNSARIMASQNALALGYHLRVFRTRSEDRLLNDRVCCQRLDGLPESIRDPEPGRDEYGAPLLPAPTGGNAETVPPPTGEEYDTGRELPGAFDRRVTETPVLTSGTPEWQQMGYDSEEEYRRARGMK